MFSVSLNLVSYHYSPVGTWYGGGSTYQIAEALRQSGGDTNCVPDPKSKQKPSLSRHHMFNDRCDKPMLPTYDYDIGNIRTGLPPCTAVFTRFARLVRKGERVEKKERERE